MGEPHNIGKIQQARAEQRQKEIRLMLLTCPGITQREISERLGIGKMAVNRHVNEIRAEWRERA